MQRWTDLGGRAPLDRRTFLRAGLGAAGALALASCAKSSPGGHRGTSLACPVTQPCPRPTIRADSGLGAGFPSPFGYQFGPAGYAVVSFLYDTLLWTDNTGKYLPWLASSYHASADGRTWTFQLRDNVSWSDGQPFTAEDVVFTFDYYTAHLPTLAGATLGVPPIPYTATALGTHTVQFKLSAPLVTFAWDVAATLPIAPKHIWSTISDPRKEQDTKVLVGTGPYALASYSQAEATSLLSARDSYFLGKPFVKSQPSFPVADQLSGLLSNTVDVGSTPPAGVRPDALSPFRSDPATYGLLATPAAFTVTLRWNLKKGGALADVRFRRACAMAIDRKAMVTRLLGGDGVAGNPGFLYPSNPYYAPVSDQYPYDPAGARALLDQAGYKMGPNGIRRAPDGTPLSFPTLVVNSAPAAGELVVGYLKAIGVQIIPTEAATLTFFSVIPTGRYEMAVGFDGGPTGDPDLMRTHFSSKATPTSFNTSGSGYANAEMDALGQQQLVTLDTAARKQIIARMQQIAAADLPLLALYYSTGYTIWRNAVFSQYGNPPEGVDGGPTYNTDKQSFVFGVPVGLKARPEK